MPKFKRRGGKKKKARMPKKIRGAGNDKTVDIVKNELKEKLKFPIVCRNNDCKRDKVREQIVGCVPELDPPSSGIYYCAKPFRAYAKTWLKAYKTMLLIHEREARELMCKSKDNKKNLYGFYPKETKHLSEYEYEKLKMHAGVVRALRKTGAYPDKDKKIIVLDPVAAMCKAYEILCDDGGFADVQESYIMACVLGLERAKAIKGQDAMIKFSLNKILSTIQQIRATCMNILNIPERFGDGDASGDKEGYKNAIRTMKKFSTFRVRNKLAELLGAAKLNKNYAKEGANRYTKENLKSRLNNLSEKLESYFSELSGAYEGARDAADKLDEPGADGSEDASA